MTEAIKVNEDVVVKLINIFKRKYNITVVCIDTLVNEIMLISEKKYDDLKNLKRYLEHGISEFNSYQFAWELIVSCFGLYEAKLVLQEVQSNVF